MQGRRRCPGLRLPCAQITVDEQLQAGIFSATTELLAQEERVSLLESSSLRLDVFFTQLNISSTLATLLLGFVLGFACNVVVLSAIGVSPRFCSRARLPPSHPPTHARTHTRARSDPPPAQTACPRPRRTSSSS